MRVLEDLEGAAPGLILLLFTDGRHLDPAGRRATLEALARWPALAWLDPREPRARAPGEGPPPGSEVPVYPATPAGILDAVRFHRGEPRTAAPPPPPPPRPTLPLPAALERHLGEALDWAQDCALLHPTVPLGLAEALRRRFHPGVPAAAIERLHTLPGTSATAAGLRLSDPVRRVLRELAADRRDPADRQRVLAFVLERIEAARPGADASDLMRIGWELAREKVRFEQDPANDCRRLAELERHPALGAAVRDWLRDFSEPGVPFLARPTRRDAAVRLARFTGNPLGLARDRLYWLGRPGRVLAGALLAGGLGLAGYGLHQAMTPPAVGAEWRWAGDPPPGETLVWAEHRAGDDWPADSDALPLAGLAGQRPVLGRTYRLHLLGQGHDGRGQEVAIERPGTYRVVLEPRDLSAPCIEEVPGLPLRIQRCPAPDGETDHTAPGWRQRLAGRVPGGPGAPRQLSLGLVLGAEALDPTLADEMFVNSWLDRLYRVDTSDPAATERALDWLAHELEPMADYVQILIWRQGGARAPDLPAARQIELGTESARLAVGLGEASARTNEVVEEDALLAWLRLSPAAVRGSGKPVRLWRFLPERLPPPTGLRLMRTWKGHTDLICGAAVCLALSS